MPRSPVAEQNAVRGTQGWTQAEEDAAARARAHTVPRARVRATVVLAVLLAMALAIAGGSASAALVGAGGGTRGSRQTRASTSARRSAHARRAGERPTPVLWVRGGTLQWSATALSHQYVESRTSAGRTTDVVVTGTTDTPPAVPGATVTYQVRPRWQAHSWSNDVKVFYPRGKRSHEGEETRREREEREARESAERERREREAKEKAEREAKERAEREAKERVEREAKERVEREARERAEREAREKAEREQREREERETGSPGGAVALSAPPGIPAPSGGWHVAYADAFGAPLGGGPGQDSTVQPSENGKGCCNNSDEVAVEQKSQAKAGPEGLELRCSYVPGGVTVAGVTSDYTCGGVTTDASFEYTYGGSETIVAECYCRWPVDLGGADPGFWSWTSGEEVDYFEGWGWNGLSWAGGSGAGVPVVTKPYNAHELWPPTLGLGFDPSLALHRYATEITPNGSAFLVREYIDGVLRWSFEAAMPKSQDGLILSNALRVTGQSDDFVARSIELYQDGAHAGQGVRGGGVAPGTTLK